MSFTWTGADFVKASSIVYSMLRINSVGPASAFLLIQISNQVSCNLFLKKHRRVFSEVARKDSSEQIAALFHQKLGRKYLC